MAYYNGVQSVTNATVTGTPGRRASQCNIEISYVNANGGTDNVILRVNDATQLRSADGRRIACSSFVAGQRVDASFSAARSDTAPPMARAYTITRQDTLVCELVNYINLHIGEDLSLKTLGRVTNYNPTYLSRTFKNITRSPLKTYMDEKRINTAKVLMSRDGPLAEIAMQVGFQNYSTFYNTFKRLTGVSPERYAREVRNSGKTEPNIH